MNLLEVFGIEFKSLGADKLSKEMKDVQKDADKVSNSLDNVAKSHDEASKGISKTVQEMRKKVAEDKNQISVDRVRDKDAKKRFDQQKRDTKDAEKQLGILGEVGAKALGSMAKLIGPASILAGAKAAITSADNTAILGNEVKNLAFGANTAIEDIQGLGNALKVYQGDAASASAVMGGLNLQLQKMQFNENTPLLEAARKYGIDLSGKGPNGLVTSEELLPRVAKRMETMTPEQRLDFGSTMGLDLPTIQLLSGGEQSYRAAVERGRGQAQFDLSAARASEDFVRAQNERRNAWNQLKTNMLGGLTKARTAGELENLMLLQGGKGAEPVNFQQRAKENFGGMFDAARASLFGWNPGTIPTTGSTSTNSVEIGEITINTQATDAAGISNGIRTQLESDLNKVIITNWSSEK